MEGGTIRVLHVDDDEGVLEVTATFLERQDDLVVETATSVEAGLERLEDGGIECIVSDYDMPGMDGLEFLTAVRDCGLEVPFVLFTGRGNEAVASEAISAGVTDYLQKETGAEQYDVLANRIRNCANQYRIEREMEEVRHRYELVARTTSDVIYDWDGTSDRIDFSSGFVEHFGTEPPRDPDQEWWYSNIHPDDRPAVKKRLKAAIDDRKPEISLEYRFEHADGDYRYVSEDRHHCYEDGWVTRVVGAFRDVTDRRRREQRLNALHEASRELMTASTTDDIVETVSRAAEEILDLSIHTIYGCDGDRLVPLTDTDRAEDLLGTVPAIDQGDGVVWEAVERGESRAFADVTDQTDAYSGDTPIRSEFCVPIGEFGVFVAGSTVPDDFDEVDVTLVKVLVANAEAALDRIEG